MDRLLSMRVFKAVVDEGGFAAGSRSLDMSAPAVTRLISDLEDHLKTRLLQRTTRRMILTEAGELYLERVRDILDRIEVAEVEATLNTSEISGTLRILATPILASDLLMPCIVEWRRRQPNVTTEVTVDPFPQSRILDFDLTLFAADKSYDADVVARPLLVSDYVVCASPAYLARHGTPAAPQELSGHGYLRFPWQDENGTAHKSLRLRRIDRHEPPEIADVEMPIVLESNSQNVLHRATIEGAGVAVLSKALVAGELKAGELVRLLPDWIFDRFTAYVALPSRQHVAKRTRAFLDLLYESVGSDLTADDAPIKLDPSKQTASATTTGRTRPSRSS